MPLSPRSLICVILGLSLHAVSCGGNDGNSRADGGTADAATADAAPSASCLAAENHSDLAWIQDNILTPGCAAFAACHKGAATSAKGLSLESGLTLARTSGIASKTDPNFNLLVEGNANQSYILMVLGRKPLPQGVVINASMPYNNPPLCSQKIEAMARWINSLPQ